MRSRHHLWKIDHDGFVVGGDHDVKFIEIAVNDTVARQFDNQVHEIIIQTFHVRNLVYVAPVVNMDTQI